ncbi:hypothetical protein SLEP1_g8181 [Rubroshorea leprosula]|uniref:Uncharacterized protein n=1 Tax=Rubroshorea leprosula TaxID=152421 RepID=A0AAV5IBT3_9ROSI|nr:hypothetical protein SLEP1_g8181 [Rubroshorea leprosula]
MTSSPRIIAQQHPAPKLNHVASSHQRRSSPAAPPRLLHPSLRPTAPEPAPCYTWVAPCCTRGCALLHLGLHPAAPPALCAPNPTPLHSCIYSPYQTKSTSSSSSTFAAKISD